MSHGLRTIASTVTLKRLVAGRKVPTVVGLAVGATGSVFMTTDHIGGRSRRKDTSACTGTITEIPAPGARPRVLWRHHTAICY